jgi:hypothetical protein
VCFHGGRRGRSCEFDIGVEWNSSGGDDLFRGITFHSLDRVFHHSTVLSFALLTYANRLSRGAEVFAVVE